MQSPVDPSAPKDSESADRYRVPRPAANAEPELREKIAGSKPGSRYLRLPMGSRRTLRRVAPGEFEATEAALEPASQLGKLSAGFRRVVIGKRLASAELPHQRLGKLKALAIYSSDALSSVAYATEAIFFVLIAVGTKKMWDYSLPVAGAIVLLTVIVVISYRQTIRAYPNGGGAYIVAKDNLGFWPSLVAGSALFVDYILTVAVSTAAGVAAITSAAPGLHTVRVEMALGFVALITLGNLRGIREAGSIFAIPTYFFLLSFSGMLIVGFARIAMGQHLEAAAPSHAVIAGTSGLTLFLLLRAFASGSAALTGIEAVANGVPNFKAPESKNASTVQVWMAIILAAFFIGTTVLAHQIHVVPSDSETIVSQIARTVFGSGLLFYAVQGGTMLILVLAANTSFADLPMLSSVMARDDVMPRQLAFRGDRLSFSNGILVLGVSASALLIIFKAETNLLIPLYAFGVFTAFTLSQVGMVIHWRRHHDPGWRTSLCINAAGAATTALVAAIVAATKFLEGAWLSIGTMGFLVLVLWRVKLHYEQVELQLDPGKPGEIDFQSVYRAGRQQRVLIPVDRVTRAVLRTVAYARSISDNVTAIHVAEDPEAGERLRQHWEEFVKDVPIVVVDSPYRSITEPVLAYIEALDHTQAGQVLTVVLPEFVTRWPWQRLLHNQLALRLRRALASRPNTIVVDIPYRLVR